MTFIDDFKNFANDNRLYSVIIGTVMASFVTEFAYSLINNIIMPLIETDFNNNKKSDIKELREIEYNFFGRKILIGKFLYSLIRFIVIIVILVMINKVKRNGTGKK